VFDVSKRQADCRQGGPASDPLPSEQPARREKTSPNGAREFVYSIVCTGRVDAAATRAREHRWARLRRRRSTKLLVMVTVRPTGPADRYRLD
jgi:hypothetical protein